ncbi:hypothetical protein ACFGVR_05995 [Mucilaginibacter sp. AW1-3]
MKSRFLFPYFFKYIGYMLAVPGLVLGCLVLYGNYKIPGFAFKLREKGDIFLPAIQNFTATAALFIFVLGLVFIAFSRLKREDELIARIRLNSLQWSVLASYAIYACLLVISITSDAVKIPVIKIIDPFDNKFTVYNLFAPLVIFIARFNYLILSNKSMFEVNGIGYLANKPWRFIGIFTSVWLILLVIGTHVLNGNTEIADSLFTLLPLCLLMWAYSKERQEDEYVDMLRLESMQVAVYANYAILLIADLLIYGFDFLLVQIINLITIPIIYIIWFQQRRLRDNRLGAVKSILV